MVQIVEAWNQEIEFPDDMSDEEISKAIKDSEAELNPDASLYTKAKGAVISGIKDLNAPSIAEQAEAKSHREANQIAPEVQGVPIRKDKYNKVFAATKPAKEEPALPFEDNVEKQEDHHQRTARQGDITLSKEEENRFQSEIKSTEWYKEFERDYGQPPNLDDSDYKYRLAWKNGVHKRAKRSPEDGKIHWESSLDDGTSLKSNKHSTFWKEQFMRYSGENPDELGLKTEDDGIRYLNSNGIEKRIRMAAARDKARREKQQTVNRAMRDRSPQEDLGVLGTLKEGAKSTARALIATKDTLEGDEKDVVMAAKAQEDAPKDKALVALMEDIEHRKKAIGENPSWMDSIRLFGSVAMDNPDGAFKLLMEQMPNSMAALASGYVGMKTGAIGGSMFGPVGTAIGAVAGGIGGLWMANVGLETGFKALEAAADGDFKPDEQNKIIREGVVKGTVITGIDAVTLGMSKWLTGTGLRAIDRATVKTLQKFGVDTTSKAAILAARQNPKISAAVHSAQQRALDATNKLGRRLARNTGAMGIESLGEGAGEYLGEYAATGEADKVEAVIEAFTSLGQSAGEVAFVSALNKRRTQKLTEQQEQVEIGPKGKKPDEEKEVQPPAIPTISGKPVSEMSQSALKYSAKHGSEKVKKSAQDELNLREEVREELTGSFMAFDQKAQDVTAEARARTIQEQTVREQQNIAHLQREVEKEEAKNKELDAMQAAKMEQEGATPDEIFAVQQQEYERRQTEPTAMQLALERAKARKPKLADKVRQITGATGQAAVPDTVTTPEPRKTLEAQIMAVDRGDKPAMLLTPGEPEPHVLPSGAKIADIPGRGKLIYKEEAALEAALNGRMGEALGYGVNEKPLNPTHAVTVRDKNGTVIQDVLTDGRPEILEAAKKVAGKDGTVEERSVEEGLAERHGVTVEEVLKETGPNIDIAATGRTTTVTAGWKKKGVTDDSEQKQAKKESVKSAEKPQVKATKTEAEEKHIKKEVERYLNTKEKDDAGELVAPISGKDRGKFKPWNPLTMEPGFYENKAGEGRYYGDRKEDINKIREQGVKDVYAGIVAQEMKAGENLAVQNALQNVREKLKKAGLEGKKLDKAVSDIDAKATKQFAEKELGRAEIASKSDLLDEGVHLISENLIKRSVFGGSGMVDGKHLNAEELTEHVVNEFKKKLRKAKVENIDAVMADVMKRAEARKEKLWQGRADKHEAEVDAHNKKLEDAEQKEEQKKEDPVRQLVSDLISRKSAADQINKRSAHKKALEAAKKFIDGESISPAKFKSLAALLKADKASNEILNKFAALAEKKKKEAGPSEKQIAQRKRLAAMAKERRIITSEDSVNEAIIKLGGIHTDLRTDLIGDKKGNQQVAFVGFLFSPKGSEDLSDLATQLADLGYLTPAEIDDVKGGADLLSEYIRDEFDGVETHKQLSTVDDEAEAALIKHQEEEQELFEETQKLADENNTDFDGVARPEDALEFNLTDSPADLLDGELAAKAEALGADIESLAMQYESDDEGFMGAITEFLEGKENEGTIAESSENGEESGEAVQGGEEFALESQSKGEVAKQERDVKEKAKAEEKAKEEAEAAKKKEAENKAIAAAQEKSAENFQLGQTAEEGLSGQQDILSAPEPKKKPVTPQVEAPAGSTPLGMAVDKAANEAATSPQNDKPQPTEAQKKAGNYEVGHVKISGIEISIENPIGSTRSGTRPDGTKWETTLKSHYGYIKGTKGKDKEHIDVFVAEGIPLEFDGDVYIIDQQKGNGQFDEHKVVMGAASVADAKQLYLENYAEGWDGIKSVRVLSMDEFKGWLENGNHQEPAGSPEAKQAGTVAYHRKFRKKIDDGKVTAEEYKSAFESLLSNEDTIKRELSAMTKAGIFKEFPYLEFRHKNEKKEVLVDEAFDLLAGQYHLSDVLTFGFGESRIGAIKKDVSKVTDASLTVHAEKVAQERKEHLAKKEEITEGMKNPKTLDDFGRILKASIQEGKTYLEARLELTKEQRATFDNLSATRSRGERDAKKETRQDQSIRAVGEPLTTTEIIKTKHTKKGHDLWQFNLEKRVERDEFKALLQQAKNLGGSYSSYRGGGAVPGWQFLTEEGAKAFKQLVAGDTEAAKDVAQTRRSAFVDDRSQSASERLTAMANALEERADAVLNADRKMNTAKRVAEGRRAEERANADKAMAATMRKIANAMDTDKAVFLDRVRQKIQVEMLEGFAYISESTLLRDKYGGYTEGQKHKGQHNDEIADYVKFPTYTVYRSDLANIGRALSETEGTKKIGKDVMKVADDVTDAYLAFAKNNLNEVARFGTKTQDGKTKPAIFKNKGDAATAIQRSGYNGKAIVLPFKRGQNIIILSPAEAIKMGVWEGNNDKLITISGWLGSELVEKIGKANRRGAKIRLPWQLENAYDSRRRLAAMGIEQPAELRAAMREYIGLRETPKEEDAIKKMEREMVGRGKDEFDFFPTPEETVDEMIQTANIQEGMSVLEPSAGMGHIAERIRAAGAEPDVVEIDYKRSELLEAKGFNVIDKNFLTMKEGAYDRILMNPPFSNRQDAAHVQHAYELLKPGGRIVAIMGEGVFFGSDKKAKAFREWLEEVGGTDEKLEQGTFLDPSLPVNTGVSARMVVIDKPAEQEKVRFSRQPAAKIASKTQGMPNEKVQRLVDLIKKGWVNAPEFVVVNNIFSPKVPDSIRKADERLLMQGSAPAVAVYDGSTNTVYIFSSRTKGPRQVVETVFHEALGHAGLRNAFGGKLQPILRQIALSRQKTVRAKAEEYGLNYDVEEERLIAAEEVLAEMAEQDPKIGFVRRAIAAIRTWLREHFPSLFKGMEISDAELVRNYLMPAREYIRSGRKVKKGDIVFFPSAAFSKAGERGPFYSELARNISGISKVANKAGELKVSAAKSWIEGRIKNGKFKAAEVEAVGLMDFLDTRKDKVTVAELTKFVWDNGIQIKETMLGDIVSTGNVKFSDNLNKYLEDNWDYVPEDTGDWYELADTIKRQSENKVWEHKKDELLALHKEVTEIRKRLGMHGLESMEPVKFSDYQMRGEKKNYRELLLQIPATQQEPYTIENLESHLSDLGGWVVRRKGKTDIIKIVPDSNYMTEYGSKMEVINNHQPPLDDAKFKSDHFDQPNIITHIRFNERIDTDGKRVLFIEEIQSDWAQKGRKKGFKSITESEQKEWDQLAEKRRKLRDRVSFLDARKNTDRFTNAEEKELLEKGREVRAIESRIDEIVAKDSGILPAPFVTDTKAWTSLAMKRMIRYAAENGFDRVAWTTGEQQVDRYSSALKKAVGRIEWKKSKDGVIHLVGYKGKVKKPDHTDVLLEMNQEDRGNGIRAIEKNDRLGFDSVSEATSAVLEHEHDWESRWEVRLSKDKMAIAKYIYQYRSAEEKLTTAGNVKVVDTNYKENEISDAIGKSMGDKIINDPNQTGVIEGDDITVSDTGMAGYYDRIIPQVTNKIIKKLGGGKIINVGINDKKIDKAYDIVRDGNGGFLIRNLSAPPESRWLADIENRIWVSKSELAKVFESKDEAYKRANEVSRDVERFNQQGFDITPAMAENVMAGQPVFQRRTDAEQSNLERFLEGSIIKEPVYHATAVKEFTGVNFDTTRSEMGSHFGTVNQARSVSEGMHIESLQRYNYKPQTMKVYINVKNPIRLMDTGSFDGDSVAQLLETRRILTDKEINDYNKIPDQDENNEGEREKIVFLQDALKKRGYDGIIYLNRREALDTSKDFDLYNSDEEFLKIHPEAQDSIIVFDQHQIKSAIGNSGEYSPVSSDMMFARAKQNVVTKNDRFKEKHKTVLSRVKQLMVKELTPGGALPEPVFKDKVLRDSEIGSVEYKITTLVTEYERAIRKEYKLEPAQLSDKAHEMLSAAMAGNVHPAIKPRTRATLVAMRLYIDSLSKKYLDVLAEQATELINTANFMKGTKVGAQAKQDAYEKVQLLEIISDNVGQYVHRSYRAFDDPKWFKKIPDEVLDEARAYLTNQVLGENPTLTPEEAENRADVIMNEIIKNDTAFDSMERFIIESKLGAKDLRILRKRKEIAEPIRKLLGEYTDPRINFAKSASKMSRLIFNQELLDAIRKQGMGTFLFTDENKPPEATARIAVDSSEVMSPLNGLWTFPEINQAFIDALNKQNLHDAYRTYLRINGLVKAGKTVFAPTTAMRNAMSAFFFTIANGHFDLSHSLKSIGLLREYFTRGGNQAKIDYIEKMIRLGVLFDTVRGGEQMKLLDDIGMADKLLVSDSLRGAEGIKKGILKTRIAGRAVVDFAVNFYRFGDDFWKIIGFENELKGWLDAGFSQAEAEKKAAERVRNTYPTYSMVGKFLVALRQFPLVGTFVSFPAEIIRTSYNITKYMIQDMGSSNKAVRKMAKKRLAGIAIASSWAQAAQVISMLLAGVDDDEDEARRKMGPPWSRNSTVIYLGRDDDGNLQYLDVSFLDPYNYLKRPFVAFSRDQPIGDKFVSAIEDLLSPFFGQDILAGAIHEAASNKKDTGSKVFSESDNPVEQGIDIADHLRKAVQPGVFSNLGRTWDAYFENISRSGRQRNMRDELAAWFGFRITTQDVKTSLFFRAYEFKDTKRDAMYGLNQVIRDRNPVNETELRAAYNKMRLQRARAFNDLSILVKAAYKSGMSRQDAIATLRSNSVSREEAIAVADDKIPKFRVNWTTARKQQRVARKEFGKDAGEMIRERYKKIQEWSRN